jgi:hypothetical protein
MKTFLSWSGETSHAVAIVLREWLPCLVNACEPYLSSLDIEKGARWATEIAKELEASSLGILCVTKDSAEAPWLNFEAGALSKTLDRTRVCPFLFRLKKSQITGPLSQFQLTVYEKEDVRALVNTINSASGAIGIRDKQLDTVFESLWPILTTQLDSIPEDGSPKQKRDPQTHDYVLEEILELLRSQHRLLASPESVLPPSYIAGILHRHLREEAIHVGVPADYPAWRDLEIAIGMADGTLRRLKGTEHVSYDDVFTIVSRITEPARVLLNKLRSSEDK